MPLPNIGATLIWHYDAETLVLNNNDPVAAWADQSPNGFDLAQATAVNQPKYVASAINSKPGVLFGQQDFLTDTHAQETTPNTTFYVMAANPTEGGGTGVVYVSPFRPFFFEFNNGGWFFGSSTSNFITFTDATILGDPGIWTGVYKAVGAILRFNGVQRVTGNVVESGATQAAIGWQDNGAAATMTVCEAIRYEGALATDDIETIEAYLDGKWINLVPDAPTNPSATATGSTSISVGWDNVSGETGYRVERSADGTTGWTDVSGNLAADTTSYSDTGLTASTQYFYRVIAFNANGDSSPSTTVNATTSAAAGPGGRKVLPSARVRMRNR